MNRQSQSPATTPGASGVNGYELSFLRWLRGRNCQVRVGLSGVSVYFADAECPFRLTPESVDRLEAGGFLERYFPEGLNIHEQAYVDTGKPLPERTPRAGRGIGGCKVVLHLRSRNLTVVELARKAGVGRSHLTQVLAGQPGRGGHTRRKVAPFLAPEELAILGWDAQGNLLTRECSTGNKCSTSGVQAGGVA